MVATVAVVVLAAAGIGAYAATGSSGTRYRTAKVTAGTVQETLSETATAQPATSVTASYAGSGTVASVDVQPGQTVTAGQVLAQLDTTGLAATLAAAKATTAEAQLALSKAEAGQLTATGAGTAGGTATTGDSGTTGGTGGGSNTATTSGLTGTTARALTATTPGAGGAGTAGTTGTTGTAAGPIPALQQQVVADQHQVDTALATANVQLAAAQNACATGGSTPPTTEGTPPTTTPTSTAAASTTPTATATAQATPTPTPTPAPSTGAGSAACLTAETALLQTQTHLAGGESTLATALTALDGALNTAVAAQQSGQGSAPAGATHGSGTSTTTGRSGAGTGSATTVTPTAAQLAAYQAKVDAATAAQAVAQQTYDMATLLAPISGTVLSVGLTPGGSATAGGVLVASPGAFVLTTDVPVADVPQVTAGEHVQVRPDGSTATVDGTVVRVAAAPDSAGDYPVTIGLATVPADVRSGSTAAVTITLSTSDRGLTVPTSAIQTTGTVKTVRVLRGGTVTVVPVTVTTSGAVLTAVTAPGLAVGDDVVIADLSQPVPASNTGTTTRTGLGGAGLGGTGLGGGLGGAGLGGTGSGRGGTGGGAAR